MRGYFIIHNHESGVFGWKTNKTIRKNVLFAKEIMNVAYLRVGA